VVIFLRMLEYYKGILILTSNRIRTFDEAQVTNLGRTALPDARHAITSVYLD
jgi:hypothetical protein